MPDPFIAYLLPLRNGGPLVKSIAITFVLLAFNALAWGQQGGEDSPRRETASKSDPGLHEVPTNQKKIVDELELQADLLTKERRKPGDAVKALSEELAKRGYIEMQLLRAQEYILETTDDGNKSDGKKTMAFFAIYHHISSSLWRLKLPSEMAVVRGRMLAIAQDKQFSPRLRKYYLKRAHDFVRDYRGKESEDFASLRRALLATSKRIEVNETEDAALRANALNIIGATELDDVERLRIIKKAYRNKNPRIQREAFRVAGYHNNHDEGMVKELLDYYERMGELDGASQKELKQAVWSIGRFDVGPSAKGYRGIVLDRLERRKTTSVDEQEKREIQKLLNAIKYPAGQRK